MTVNTCDNDPKAKVIVAEVILALMVASGGAVTHSLSPVASRPNNG